MTNVMKPDICVIGAGPAGLTVATFAAMLGVPVVLVEKGRMGGSNLNAGGVPATALRAAAKRAHDIRNAHRFGIETGSMGVDFARTRAHIASVVAAIRPTHELARFTALGATVIAGEAIFTGPRTLAAGDHIIEARRFVIATGATPTFPPIDGLADVPFLTSETIFALPELPRHLAIIGGDAMALEMAQTFHRLGSAVTLLAPAMIAAAAEREQSLPLKALLQREGLDIHESVTVTSVKQADDALILTVTNGAQTDELRASHLFIAMGHKPDTDTLGLAAAGIRSGDEGIIVDNHFRTHNRHVYAIGDCIGGRHQSVSHAVWAATQVAQAIIFRRPVNAAAALVPSCIHTDPGLAHVGLTEAMARQNRHGVQVLRWPFHDNDRAVAEGRPDGAVKLVLDHRDHILGVSILGPEAGELIVPWVMAVQQKMKATDMPGFILPYPTLMDAGKRAAGSIFATKLNNPWLKRVIALLRPFG